MSSFFPRRGARVAPLIAVLALLAASIAPAGAQGSPVTVDVNGNQINLNPPPVVRAGRVFVPLRGVFQKLGATVAYQNGEINATGNDRTISLRIGSPQAVVNGQTQTLDVAPFIIGASTYVPLRFIAQALGATVRYNGANRVVSIVAPNASNGPQNVTYTPEPNRAAVPGSQPTAQSSNVQLKDLQPGRGASVESKRPTISAQFTAPVDPNTVHVDLDGLNVTNESTRSETGFVYSPPSDLQAGEHQVVVRGKDAHGATFQREWRFSSGTAAVKNFLELSQPAQNATVGTTFTVSGRTLPNAHVHVDAGAVAQVGGVFALGTGAYSGDVTADANGDFSQQVSINAVSGGRIGLTVTSTDPKTKGTASVKRELSVR